MYTHINVCIYIHLCVSVYIVETCTASHSLCVLLHTCTTTNANTQMNERVASKMSQLWKPNRIISMWLLLLYIQIFKVYTHTHKEKVRELHTYATRTHTNNQTKLHSLARSHVTHVLIHTHTQLRCTVGPHHTQASVNTRNRQKRKEEKKKLGIEKRHTQKWFRFHSAFSLFHIWKFRRYKNYNNKCTWNIEELFFFSSSIAAPSCS